MADGNRSLIESQFAVAGMTCEGCRAKVIATLSNLADEVTVTREPPLARLRADHPITLDTVQRALAAAGKYTATNAPMIAATVASETETNAPTDSWLKTYYPLLIIGAYIGVASLTGAGLSGWMTNFMAGFFLVFSAFKFLDLKGFATSYATYDLLAKRWSAYGLIYPFLELALGLAFLFRFVPMA